MERISVPFELKAAGGKGKFEGYGAVFGNKDLGDDIIIEGAFEQMKLTRDGKIRIALYHDTRLMAGKAAVSQDSSGLYVDGQLNMNLSYVPDAYELMKDGILDGMSVGFNILPGGAKWLQELEEEWARYISAAELWEVSIVPFGMNPEALIESVKSADALADIRSFESFLRKQGLTRREAKAIASGGYKALQRDAASAGSLSDSEALTSEMLADLKTAIANYRI
ncbi:MAG: HK97 family phage prohead protease [Gammaproteobacteria bacterium]|nr:HK97 family phage prohead protease [Gammaproteobacteria bacterium]